jgi:hypothetical protein
LVFATVNEQQFFPGEMILALLLCGVAYGLRSEGTEAHTLPELTYYQELCVAPDADKRTIKKAYRKLALIWHPDRKTGEEEKFKRILKAYETLTDEGARLEYDDTLRSLSQPEAGCDQLQCPGGSKCKSTLCGPKCVCRKKDIIKVNGKRMKVRVPFIKGECMTKLMKAASSVCCQEGDGKPVRVPPEFQPIEETTTELEEMKCPESWTRLTEDKCKDRPYLDEVDDD